MSKKSRKCNLESCGKVYEYVQPSARFCSKTCKQKAYLLKIKLNEIKAIPPMNTEELTVLKNRLKNWEHAWNNFPGFQKPELEKRIKALRLLISAA
jgi:hypothetical protein